MFCATDMCGHSAYDWNIIAQLRFSAGRFVMSVSPTRMRPDASGTKPATARSSDVLPHPELPSNAISSP